MTLCYIFNQKFRCVADFYISFIPAVESISLICRCGQSDTSALNDLAAAGYSTAFTGFSNNRIFNSRICIIKNNKASLKVSFDIVAYILPYKKFFDFFLSGCVVDSGVCSSALKGTFFYCDIQRINRGIH